MQRSYWRSPAFWVLAGGLLFLWVLAHYHLEPIIDHLREIRYAHPKTAPVTVVLVWPPPVNALERRYSFEVGAQNALTEYLRSGGEVRHIRLRMVPEQFDGMGEILEQQVDDPSVVAMLGFLTSVDTHKACVISDSRDILVMTAAGTWPLLTKHGFENLLRLVPDDVDEARILVNYMLQRRMKKIGVIFTMTLHGTSVGTLVVSKAREAGINVAFAHAYLHKPRPNFPDVLATIGPLMRQHGDIEALVMIEEPGTNSRMLRHLRRAGLKLPIMGSDSLDIPNTWAEAGEAAEGICFVSLWSAPEGSPRLRAMYDAVVRPEDQGRIRVSDFVHYGYIQGYETMRLYLTTVKEAGGLYPRQLGILFRNGTWDTLYGRLWFTPDGDVVGRHLVLNQITKGRPHVVLINNSLP